MTRSVAIIGAGQIGFEAACAFYDDWPITVYARSKPTWFEYYPCNFSPYIRGEMPEPVADVILDTIAFDEGDIAQYDPSKVGRLIVISSASVYCDDQGRTLDEAQLNGWPKFAGPVTEEQCTVPPGPQTYSTRKVRMENKAREMFGERAVVLRPCVIYGAFSRHPREWWFVKRFLDGRKRIPLLMDGKSQFQTTCAEDIALAAIRSCELDIGGVFNVADEYCPTVREIGEAIGKAIYADAEYVDAGEVGLVGRTPWSVGSPFIVSSTKMAKALRAPAAIYWARCFSSASELVDLNPSNWRAAFPQLAAYPWDLFDYEAEDRFFASL